MSLPALWENVPFKELCPPDDLDKSPGSPPRLAVEKPDSDPPIAFSVSHILSRTPGHH